MLRKKIDTGFLAAAMGTLPVDRLNIFLLEDKKIRGAIAQGTILVNEMQANHELGIIETLALGHAYLAAGLLTHNLTAGKRIALQIDSAGPLQGLVVEANAAGDVRGYLRQKELEIKTPPESFDLAPFIGIGFLKITKYLKKLSQPFSGQVVLEHSNLAEDLVHYFYTSEQIPTAFNLSLHFDKQGRVAGAGGFFLQAMPGAEPAILEALTGELSRLPSLGKQLAGGQSSTAYIQEFLSPYKPVFLAEKPLRFFCSCSRERFATYLSSLPRAELMDMREKGPFPVITTCHNCNSAYDFTQQDLAHIAGGT